MTEKNNSENRILTVPNLRCVIRLLLVPVFIWLYNFRGMYYAAFAVVLFSSITDMLDGYIARHCNMISSLGKALDPIADKLTQGIVLISLGLRYRQIFLLVGLFAVKEILMAVLGSIAIKKCSFVPSARWYGKVCTIILDISVLALLVFPYISEAAVDIIIGICAVACIFSAVMYCIYYAGVYRGEELREKKTFNFSKLTNIVMVITIAAFIVLCIVFRDEITAEAILSYTPENEFLAAVFMLVLFALKSLSVVIYIGVLYIACGMMFPLWEAIMLSTIGTAITVAIPYILGKKFGTDTVDRFAAEHKKLGQLRALRQKNDFFFSLILRLLSILPCDIISYYCGAVNMEAGKYMLSCILGFMPQIILFALMGDSIRNIHSPQFLISLGITVLLIIVSLLVFILYSNHHKKKNT